MEIAKSMRLGGEIVHANGCNFSSYDELKLRCYVCGEPVYLKKGKYRKPHFAHIHATSSRQVEECELRASTYGSSTEINKFIQDRGQRLEIFQNNFLKMLSAGEHNINVNLKFYNWVNSVKSHNNQAINNLVQACTLYFLTHQKEMRERYCIPLQDIKNNKALLQQQIALEAIDYLCVKSSLQLLEYVLLYSIYKLYGHKQNDFIKFIQKEITPEHINNISNFVTQIIFSNNWLKAFNNTIFNSEAGISIVNFNSTVNKLGTVLLSPLQKFLQDALCHTTVKLTKNINSSIINASQLSSYERDKLKSPLPLEYTFSAVKYGNIDRKTNQPNHKQAFVTCKLYTEVNLDAKTALKFSFMTSQSIKTESRMQNSKNKFIKVETEIFLPAIIYSFDYDLTLKLETYSNPLFSKGGNLTEYPFVTRRDEVARLMESMLLDEKIKFLKTYKDSEGKLRILNAYDCSVLLLYELLKKCYSNKCKPMEFNTVMQCIIDAADAATKLGIPLIHGMLLHSLFIAAKAQLNSTKLDKVPTRNLSKLAEITTKVSDTDNPKKIDNWCILSQSVTSTETTIIAMNTLKYRNCVLMYKPYQLEINEYGILSDPQWLKHTLKSHSIKANDVLGYVGVRHPNGSVEKLGIVHWHNKKDKTTKEIRKQLWFTAIQRYEMKQSIVSVETGKQVFKMVAKYERDSNGLLQRVQVPTYVNEYTNSTATAKQQIKIDPELAVFMSLYGISHNAPIKPGKLNTINDESKYININWSALIRHKVAPMNKDNEVLWSPKFSCPYTLVE